MGKRESTLKSGQKRAMSSNIWTMFARSERNDPRIKKGKFATQLEDFFKVVDSGQLPVSVSSTVTKFEDDVRSELESKKKPEQKALAIGRIEIGIKVGIGQASQRSYHIETSWRRSQ